jgi:hypothetical protein
MPKLQDVHALYGGDLHGFVLDKGDKDALAPLRVSDEFVRMIAGVQLLHERVGEVWAYTHSEMLSLFEMWGGPEVKLR